MTAVRIEINTSDKIIGANEVACLLGMSESWVRKRVFDGTIPSRKLGGARKFIEREVLEWFNKLMR